LFYHGGVGFGDYLEPAIVRAVPRFSAEYQQPRVDSDLAVEGLLAVARAMVSLTARSLAQLDVSVTLPQFRALVVLAISGPRRIVDLAAEFGVQPSAATRMCDRLVRKQLVARHVRSDDRRVAWVELTSTGRALVAEVMDRRRDTIADLVSSVTFADAEGFSATLQALASAAGELPEQEWQARWHEMGGRGLATTSQPY
jgi:DNA-binding MarR family transcriptional regulator